MPTNKIEVTLAAVNAGVDVALLVSKDPIFPYKDGVKLSDDPIGTKLTVLLQNARMAPLVVKFDHHDPLPKVSDEEIAEATGNLQFLFVKIPDAVVTLYSGSNSYGINMSATAKTAELVSPSK